MPYNEALLFEEILEAQGCFLDESHGSRVFQRCLPLSNEFMLGDTCQLIVLIRLQWHQSELNPVFLSLLYTAMR